MVYKKCKYLFVDFFLFFCFSAIDGLCSIGEWTGTYQTALFKSGIVPPGLNHEDHLIFEKGAIASIALAALNMYATGSLLGFADW